MVTSAFVLVSSTGAFAVTSIALLQFQSEKASISIGFSACQTADI